MRGAPASSRASCMVWGLPRPMPMGTRLTKRESRRASGAGFPVGRKLVPTLLCTGALGVYAYAIAVTWLSPATIAVIRANAPRVAENFRAGTTQRMFLASVAALFLLAAWAMARWKLAHHTRFALLASLVLASSALGSFWFRLSLLPQPARSQDRKSTRLN